MATRSTSSPKGRSASPTRSPSSRAGAAPIPRIAANRIALKGYRRHPHWAYRDPTTHGLEPVYSVHYNDYAARLQGAQAAYDVGIQRTCWQIHSLTNWMGDAGFLKTANSQYRAHVYLSDVVRLGGRVDAKEVDAEGNHVAQITSWARNQRGQDVMPGFGRTGPYADKLALDLTIQAMSGVMSATGETGGRPLKAGVPVADFMSGTHLYGAIVTALYERERTGRGRVVEVSMLESMFATCFLPPVIPMRATPRQSVAEIATSPIPMFRLTPSRPPIDGSRSCAPRTSTGRT